MWFLFEPRFSWFAVICNILVLTIALNFDNMWLILLNIPLSFLDGIMFNHYFMGEDDE